jgi:hypothetical protein
VSFKVKRGRNPLVTKLKVKDFILSSRYDWSIGDIARQTKISHKVVQKKVDELLDEGCIVITRFVNRNTIMYGARKR